MATTVYLKAEIFGPSLETVTDDEKAYLSSYIDNLASQLPSGATLDNTVMEDIGYGVREARYYVIGTDAVQSGDTGTAEAGTVETTATADAEESSQTSEAPDTSAAPEA
ncbi:hypothetical protein GOZ96_04795 [Agrobacterium vitis]|uniref:Uncharacterized protein n=1 Tax=Agrobacterium vitis TaxID=373 RepID=A0A7J4X560_AGRVI|nr:hypothetical protein [Agrobacterium vitis]KAA3527059.1 hypothetical protein DXT89_14085 [Agrobacterium vitis]MUZ95907.1 hypothetical protein [Agrobacterium vitis]